MSSTEIYGARLLKENGVEEESLRDLLIRLRTTSIPNLPKTGIQELDALWYRHGSNIPLSIKGRGFVLLYHLISSMLTKVFGTVIVLDLTSKFSASHLSCEKEVLTHLHVYFPTKDNLKVTFEGLKNYMLYGEHSSKGREWVDTILIGGDVDKGLDPSITVGWKGWLKVERAEIKAFGDGIGIEEVWKERDQRQAAILERGWLAESKEGVVRWM